MVKCAWCGALVLALATVACDEPLSLETFEARAVATEGWSGNDIAITSQGFAATQLLPSAWLDDLPLAVHRTDDTTVAVTLPATSGQRTLTVRGVHIEPLIVPLTVYGYAGFDDTYPDIIGDVLVWPRTGHASVLGVSRSGLASIDLDTRVVTAFDSVFDPARCWGGLRGPGVTYRDSVFVVLPVGSPSVESWRLGPTPVRLDAHPEHGIPRQLMQLGDDTWLRGGAHTLSIRSRTDSTQPYQEIDYAAEETEGVHLSPRKDRATIRVDYAWDGLPVFDAPSGSLAYRVDNLMVVNGVDFSAVGGATWVESQNTGRVVLLEARPSRLPVDSAAPSRRVSVGTRAPARRWPVVRPASGS